jgi:CRP/FNR family cyclic AMP-dependent transcriptional regulator
MTRNVATFSACGFDEHLASTTIHHYAKGQPIFSKGEVADAIYCVTNGNVKLSVRSERGKNAVLAFLHAGQCFGENCLGVEKLRSYTATAVRGSTIARIARGPLLRRLRREPILARLFISYLLLSVAGSQDDQANQLLNSSERRLARTLVQLTAPGIGTRGSRRSVTIDQGTLAEMVGTTRSRVSYFMNRFRKKGLIDYNGNLQVHKKLLAFLAPRPSRSR